jgi:hypothetical protein
VHGLPGILPKQTGLTHDSLLTGDTLLASPKLCSMGVMEPADCLKVPTRSAFESYPRTKGLGRYSPLTVSIGPNAEIRPAAWRPIAGQAPSSL